jgi:D-amino-acid oxidase
LAKGADIDVLVIGAGVVGLAAARACAQAGRATLVAEAAGAVGQGVSARSSEVIHAGVYYPPGSLKARLCVEGRALLYDYCAARGVAHRRCGKIIVAQNASDAPRLAALAARAQANGVTLEPLSRADLARLEPALRGAAGLLSPQTGIVDTHGLMLALQGDCEAAGAAFAFRTPMESARVDGDGLVVAFGGAEPMRLRARHVVIAAGLSSPRLARAVEGLRPHSAPRAFFAKGSYFSLARRSPFSRLVYPLPEPGGLGVHLTLDLAGRARFGPDVEWLDAADESALDYAVDPARAARFYAAIRAYWPDLREGELRADYAGVRPKIAGPDDGEADFLIHDARDHGAPGLVALYGVESPGLTSALAIGAHVARLVARA